MLPKLKPQDFLHLPDNGHPGDVLEIQEFFRGAAFGLFGDGQGINRHRHRGQSTHHRFADAPRRVVVFHGDDVSRGPGGVGQGGRGNGLDAVKIDDPDGKAHFLKGVVSRQGLEQGDAGADHRGPVLVAVAQDL